MSLALVAAPAAAARGTHPTRAQKALAKELRHNPRALLRPGFLRKAATTGLDLPYTVRLSRRTDDAGGQEAPNDTLHLSWDQFPDAVLGGQPPIDPPGAYDSSTTLTLQGSYSGIARFGADTSGYAHPWIVELVQGQSATLTSASPTTLLLGVSDPGCTNTDLTTTPPWTFTSVEPTYGTLDLFGGGYTGSLHLRATTSATCGGSTWSTPAGAPPFSVPLLGRFRISPAITADGRLRLGTITIATPGPSDDGNHAELHLHCDTCSPNDLLFTGRLKTLAITAELLIGS